MLDHPYVIAAQVAICITITGWGIYVLAAHKSVLGG